MEEGQRSPAYPIIGVNLGESIDRPDVRNTVDQKFVGGVAIVLDNIQPASKLNLLEERLDQVRSQPDFQSTLGRPHQIIPLEEKDGAVTSAVLLAADPEVSYFTDELRWGADVRDMEWRLVRDALTRPTMFLSSQSFSAAIAATFAAQAVIAVVLSAMIIVIYVWVRFNAVRFSVAAIVPTLLDCCTAVGLIALAELICDAAPGLARSLALEPFKLDLTVVASLLTILGYSINDKIVVLDRIRENRGKLPYVTRDIVNTSVNQTMSRTLMTGTTTILSTIVLYIVGGEGVRAFAYALGLGAIIGTFSSVAIGAPLAWSRAEEERVGKKRGPDAPPLSAGPRIPVPVA
jgi:SecD/SecF fusion protein